MMNTEMRFISVKKLNILSLKLVIRSLFLHFFEKYRKNYKICRLAMTTITEILHVPKILWHH